MIKTMSSAHSLILASASPRRRELLAALGVPFVVCVSPVPEPREKPAGVSPLVWAQALAYFKARAVAEQNSGQWVLGADTIVVSAGQMLGKPADEADARRMLLLQAGRFSDVITGLCLLRRGENAERQIGHVNTRVWMRAAPREIEAYLRGGDWRGKAGAYGIQDVGDRLIERIDGSFSNVVGLPVERVAAWLRKLDLAALKPLDD